MNKKLGNKSRILPSYSSYFFSLLRTFFSGLVQVAQGSSYVSGEDFSILSDIQESDEMLNCFEA